MNIFRINKLQMFASRTLATLGVLIISSSAHAVFIDFDDIPYTFSHAQPHLFLTE